MKLTLRPARPGALRPRARAARRGGPALRRLDAGPARPRRLHRPRRRLPLPARQGQLHRGRHVGDPAQHRRRAGARACPAEPASTRTSPGRSSANERPRPALHRHRGGPASKRARLLADRCDSDAVAGAIYDGDRSLVDGLWKSLAATSAWPACWCPRSAAARARRRARPRWCSRSWAARWRRCRS